MGAAVGSVLHRPWKWDWLSTRGFAVLIWKEGREGLGLPHSTLSPHPSLLQGLQEEHKSGPWIPRWLDSSCGREALPGPCGHADVCVRI